MKNVERQLQQLGRFPLDLKHKNQAFLKKIDDIDRIIVDIKGRRNKEQAVGTVQGLIENINNSLALYRPSARVSLTNVVDLGQQLMEDAHLQKHIGER